MPTCSSFVFLNVPTSTGGVSILIEAVWANCLYKRLNIRHSSRHHEWRSKTQTMTTSNFMATFNDKRSSKDGIFLVKWNKSNRLARFNSISFMFSLSFHLYVVDFDSNIKTLTTNITESNSYLRTRTTIPHVFWNPWKSKNRRVPAVYRPLFWCGRVGLGRADLISNALERNKENRKKRNEKKKR